MARLATVFRILLLGLVATPLLMVLVSQGLGLCGLAIVNLDGAGPHFSCLSAFQYWWGKPNFGAMLARTISLGAGSAILALGLAVLLFALPLKKRPWSGFWLLFALAIPHLSLAVGIKSLFMETGLWARLYYTFTKASPSLTAEKAPLFFSLCSLALKESFFFLYVLEATFARLPGRALAEQATVLGYDPMQTFKKVTLPLLWPHLRWPFLLVLSYSLSSIEVPGVYFSPTAPTFALALYQIFAAPDSLSLIQPWLAGSILLVGLFIGLSLLFWLLERWVLNFIKPITYNGLRIVYGVEYWGPKVAKVLLPSFLVLSFVMLLFWSTAGLMPFPVLWPDTWSFNIYANAAPALWRLGLNSFWLASSTSLVALVIFLWQSEKPFWKGYSQKSLVVLSLLYASFPLVSLVLGFQLFINLLPLEGYAWGLFSFHGLMVYSYLNLLLAEQQTLYNEKFSQISLSLGVNPLQTYFRVKLPLVRKNVLAAFAIALSVSFSLYLPTYTLSGGRFPTLVTETFALSSSANLRTSAAYGLLFSLLPLLGFLLLSFPQRKA